MLQIKTDMQSEQHTAVFSNNSQAKILQKRERERERERSQRHSLLRIKMERDLSIYLDRSCKRVWLAIEYSYRKREREREREYRVQTEETLKRKRNSKMHKAAFMLGPIKKKRKEKGAIPCNFLINKKIRSFRVYLVYMFKK